MIVGILLGLSISILLFSAIILIMGETSVITAAIIGGPTEVFYPILAIVISSVMILLIVFTILKKRVKD